LGIWHPTGTNVNIPPKKSRPVKGGSLPTSNLQLLLFYQFGYL
jgi:hypothetical protein